MAKSPSVSGDYPSPQQTRSIWVSSSVIIKVGSYLKLLSLWFLIKQPVSRVKGMPKIRVQMKSRHPQMPSPFLMNMSSNVRANTSSMDWALSREHGLKFSGFFFYVLRTKAMRTGAMRVKAVWPAIGKDS